MKGLKEALSKFDWQEFRQSREIHTYVLVVISAILLMIVAYLTYAGLAKRKIFPSADKRLDVTTLYVAAAEDVCGENGKAPHTALKYEACIKDLSLNDGERSSAWVKMEVPNLDWIMDNGRPSFGGTLRKTHRPTWEKIYKELKTTIVGFNIPAEYYSYSDHTWNFNSLFFSGMRNGIVCIGGGCNFHANITKEGGANFPLVLKDVRFKGRGGTIPAFAFANHIERPYSLSLRDGVFVTAETDSFQIKNLYSLNLQSEYFAYGLLFVGVFLLAFWQAAVWRQYLDYAAFLYFVSSLVCLAILENFILLSRWDHESWLMFSINIFVWLNVAVAATFFSFSTTRWRKLSVFKHAIFPTLLISVPLIMIVGVNDSDNAKSLRYYTSLMGIAIFVLPTAVHFCGFWKCRTEFLTKSILYFSEKEALKRRQIQQIVYGFAALSFGFNHLINGYLYFSGLRSISIFTPGSGLAVVAMLFVLMHPSLSRLKRTLGREWPKTEVGRLKLLLTHSDFMHWASRPKSGIFFEVDLAGSSELTPIFKEKLQIIMRTLESTLLNDLRKSGMGVIESKPLGDAIMMIVDRKSPNLKFDCVEVVEFVQKNGDKYNRLVRTIFKHFATDEDLTELSTDEIYLHFNVSVVTDYTLGKSSKLFNESLGEKIKTEFGIGTDSKIAQDSLDFISQEMNYFMKFVPKAKKGEMTVSGPRECIPEEMQKSGVTKVKDLYELNCSHRSAIAIRNIVESDLISLTLKWEKSGRSKVTAA